MMKRKLSIDFLILLFCSSILMGCEKPSPAPTLPPVEPQTDELMLSLSNNDISDFYTVTQESETKMDLDTSNIRKHFGRRTDLFVPSKIIIDDDSLKVIKPFAVTEQYAISWRDNNLYFRTTSSSEWKAFGLTKNGNHYVLNTYYYLIEGGDDLTRTTVIGQGYAKSDDFFDLIQKDDSYVLLVINSRYDKEN